MAKNKVEMTDVALDAGLALVCLLVSLGCFVYGQEQGGFSLSGQDVNALAVSLAQNMEGALDFRDPFQVSLPRKPVEIDMASPPAPSQANLPAGLDSFSFSVSGLAWGTDKPRAIINERVLGIGDVFTTADASEKIEVVDISKEGVLVKYGNQQLLLKRASGLPEKETDATEPNATTEQLKTNQTNEDFSDVKG